MRAHLIFLALLALLDEAAALSFDKASQHLEQPSYDKKPEGKDEDHPHVVRIEKKIREEHKKLMTAIEQFRAEICAKMKDEHGMAFKTFAACHKFMKKVCHPGKDKEMDGDKQEISSGKGYCKEYFPEPEEAEEPEEPKEEVKEEKEAVKAIAPAPGPHPGPAPAPKQKETAPAPAPVTAAKAPASGAGPAPGPMGAPGPGPAPVPGPFIPGKSGGKPWGTIPEDEAWYYEKNGKDIGRLHMDEGQKLPEQGYWGKLVGHDEAATQTSDWMQEFGPKSGHASIEEVCRKFPNNPWCIGKGYGKKLRCSGRASFVHFLPLLIALFAGM